MRVGLFERDCKNLLLPPPTTLSSPLSPLYLQVWTNKDSIFVSQPHLYGDARLSNRCFGSDWPMCKTSKMKDTALALMVEKTLHKYFDMLRVSEKMSFYFSLVILNCFIFPGSF